MDINGEPKRQRCAGCQIPRLVIAVRLDSESQFRAAQNDRPAHLQPGDEQRNGRESAVDRGILGHADLEGEIEPQNDVESRAGGDAGYDAGQDLYLAVRHEKVEEDEAEPDKNVRHELDKEMHRGRKAGQEGQLLDDEVGLGFKKDRDGRGKYQKEGQKDYDGAVVDDLPAEGAALNAAENVVERKLDVAKKLDDGPKQDQYADSRHGSELRVLQGVLGRLRYVAEDHRDGFRQLLVARKARENVLLDALQKDVLKIETSRDGERNGQQRHDRQKGIERQSRRSKRAAVMPEFQAGQGKDPEKPDPESLHGLVTVKREPPDLLEEKARRPLRGLNYFFHFKSLFFEEAFDGVDSLAGGFADAFNGAFGSVSSLIGGVLGGTDSGAELVGQFFGGLGEVYLAGFQDAAQGRAADHLGQNFQTDLSGGAFQILEDVAVVEIQFEAGNGRRGALEFQRVEFHHKLVNGDLGLVLQLFLSLLVALGSFQILDHVGLKVEDVQLAVFAQLNVEVSEIDLDVPDVDVLLEHSHDVIIAEESSHFINDVVLVETLVDGVAYSQISDLDVGILNGDVHGLHGSGNAKELSALLDAGLDNPVAENDAKNQQQNDHEDHKFDKTPNSSHNSPRFIW